VLWHGDKRFSESGAQLGSEGTAPASLGSGSHNQTCGRRSADWQPLIIVDPHVSVVMKMRSRNLTRDLKNPEVFPRRKRHS